MEKIIYLLAARRPADPGAIDVDRLGPALLAAGAVHVSLAVDDADVAPADDLRRGQLASGIDAVACAWLHSVAMRSAIETLLEAQAKILAAYRVEETAPLVGPQPAADGQRTPGMLQVALFGIPPGMEEHEWLSVWRNDHTAVAIATQSTFAYRQNRVLQAMTDGAPPFAGIVEESFPAEAMSSQHVFFAAGTDDDKLSRHRRRMWESSKRFIDLATIEVLPLSEYSWGQRPDPRSTS